MTVREEASQIIGLRITPGKWQETLDSIWTSGRPDGKAMKQLVFMLCRRVDELEQNNEKPIQSTS